MFHFKFYILCKIIKKTLSLAASRGGGAQSVTVNVTLCVRFPLKEISKQSAALNSDFQYAIPAKFDE